MSWDVSLVVDAGGPERLRLATLDANCTYNLGAMFADACGSMPSAWDGMTGAEVADICATILDAFNRDPERFKLLNPLNGWGDFEGAREFIQLINDACRLAPSAFLRVM